MDPAKRPIRKKKKSCQYCEEKFAGLFAAHMREYHRFTTKSTTELSSGEYQLHLVHQWHRLLKLENTDPVSNLHSDTKCRFQVLQNRLGCTSSDTAKKSFIQFRLLIPLRISI